MTVSTTTLRADYTGNEVTQDFTIPFYFVDAAHIEVLSTNTVTGAVTTLALTTDYTVTGMRVADGGSCHILVAPDASTRVSILRKEPLTQGTHYIPGDPFPAASHEDALDEATMGLQQLQEQADRSFKMAANDASGLNTELPSPVVPNAAIGVNAAGTRLAYLLVAGVTEFVSSFNGRTGPVLPALGDYPASLVPFTQAGTGAVASTVDAQLKALAYNAVTNYGCDNTGATNCTTQLLAFFNACITNKHSGYIPAGTYKITTGVLKFDTPFVDAAWPMIYTDGYQATILSVDSATATNAPVLQWTNGTATGAAGRYWRGGYLGGLTINDATGATASSRHAVSLRGVWGLHFDYMASNGVRGNMVEIEPLLYSGTNPDPYAVSFCVFEGLEANSCAGAAVKNENYVGFTGNRIKVLRAIGAGAGIFYGAGASNTIESISASGCNGWAVDDGGFADHTGGGASRFVIGQAELDNVENGFRLNSLYSFSLGKIRFIHRYNVSPNASAGYWPRTALSVAGGTSPSVLQGSAQFIHRIEAGGTKPDLGVFYNFNNTGNDSGVYIDYYPIDNAGFGFVDSDFYTNNANAKVVLSTLGRITLNQIQSYANSQVLLGATGGLIAQSSNFTYASGTGMRVSDTIGSASASTGAIALPNGGIGTGGASYFGGTATFANTATFTSAAVFNNAIYAYWKDSGATNRRVLGINGSNQFVVGPADVSVSVATLLNSGSVITFQVNGSSGTFINAGSIDAAGNFNPKFYTSSAVGTAVASAATITPTGPVFHVTGSTTINTINLPYVGFTGRITIICDAAVVFGTSGNIAVGTTVATPNTVVDFIYDGSKWYPK